MTNRYSDYGSLIATLTDEQQLKYVLKYINETVSKSTLLGTSESQNLVAVKYLKKTDFGDGVRNFYELMQDANGVAFLVELKSTDAESVEDVYYNCSTAHILPSPFYEKFLPKILEAEKQNATK